MSLQTRILEDMKSAMKEKRTLELEVVRTIKSQVKYYQIEKKLDEVSDEDVVQVVSKMIKQRKDAFTQYKDAGRDELADKEEKEIKVLERYLPEQLSDDELDSLVKEVVKEVGASEKKQMGLVMKALMPKIAGRADGKKVSQTVSKYLN